MKLKQPLLALGDAVHAFDSCKPRSIKAALLSAAANEAMELYEQAVKDYSMILYMPLQESVRRGIEERLAKAKALLARKQAEVEAKAANLKFLHGAHKSSINPEAEKQLVRASLESGNAKLPSVWRGGEGGPRHPPAVIAAFNSSFTTKRVTESSGIEFPQSVQLKDMGAKGVGVVATRDIPAKSLFFVDRPLLASSVQGDRVGVSAGLDCYHCTRPVAAASAVRCDCDRVFCSTHCKDTALSLYHGALCSMAGGKAVAQLEAHAATGHTASARYPLMMWKMLGFALQQAKARGTPLQPPADAPPFCFLSRLSDWRSAEAGPPEQFTGAGVWVTRQWSIFRSLLTESVRMEPALSIRWVADAMSTIAPNSIGLSGAGWRDIAHCGQVLMGGGSFFNHSCEPNAMYASDSDACGPSVHFVSKRAIKSGEEVTIAYVNGDAPFEARESTLTAQYGFHCDCPKCKRERPSQ